MMGMPWRSVCTTAHTDGEERACTRGRESPVSVWLRGLVSSGFVKSGYKYLFASDTIECRTEEIVTIRDERLLNRIRQRQVLVVFMQIRA